MRGQPQPDDGRESAFGCANPTNLAGCEDWGKTAFSTGAVAIAKVGHIKVGPIKVDHRANRLAPSSKSHGRYRHPCRDEERFPLRRARSDTPSNTTKERRPMKRSTDRILTTHVGSLPHPPVSLNLSEGATITLYKL